MSTPSETAAPRPPARTRVWRRWDWARPVRPTRRETITVPPAAGVPPAVRLLCVPDVHDGGAEALRGWLVTAAERGHPASAVSPRGLGGTPRPGPAPATALREWVHDVVQAAVALPERCVLVGRGTGAWTVAHALHRYPAAGAVLIDPVGLPGHRGGAGLLPRRPRLATRILLGRDPRRPATAGPLLVAGGPGYPAKALAVLAQRHGAVTERLSGGIEPVLDWLAGTGLTAGQSE